MLAAPERYLNGVDYRFSTTELFLGPGLHWPLSRVFALRADGALVGKLTHVAYDAPRAAPRSLSRLSYGGAVHAGVTAFPWTSLLIEFRTGAEGLLARGRYLSRDRELIWQEPVISFSMGVFVGWASRSRTRVAEYSEAREGSESREQ